MFQDWKFGSLPVHDHVNRQVQCNWNPRDCSISNKLCVAKKSCRTVVVGVEKGKGLLLKDKENSVNQLEVFGQVIHLHELESSWKGEGERIHT